MPGCKADAEVHLLYSAPTEPGSVLFEKMHADLCSPHSAETIKNHEGGNEYELGKCADSNCPIRE